MMKGARLRCAGTVSLLLLTFCTASSQDPDDHQVRIMFYNAENLFDVSDDTSAGDDEFLPGAIRRWTARRLDAKINLLAKTIIAAGEWSPPIVVGMCELENRAVIGKLINTSLLARYKYEIVHHDSPDPRGIDVGLIYRSDHVRIISSRSLIPDNYNLSTFTTRDVLHTRLLISDDTIDLFLNHWPSRRGGVLAADKLRTDLAKMVRRETDSIFSADGRDAKIIITGDFNCNPDDNAIRILTSGDDSGMINLTSQLRDSEGTYRYQGTWEMIDQVIVSKSLLDDSSGLYTEHGGLNVFRAPFLLYSDPRYPGYTPLPTYSGFIYKGGCSDHLPLVLTLSLHHSF